MLWKCCTQYASKFGKLSSGHRTGKDVFIPIPKKGNAKECSNYHTVALISHASKVMLKILQAKLPVIYSSFPLAIYFTNGSVKVLYSICQQIWKTHQWPQDWKRSVFIPIPKEGNAKECSNYHTVALISHSSKVMLKILQSRLQQYVNQKLSNV